MLTLGMLGLTVNQLMVGSIPTGHPKYYGARSSVAERRSVAADVVGSNPSSRPNPSSSG